SAEQRADGGFAHVQSPRIGTEGRKHEAAAIGHEAAPADGMTAARDRGARMKMAGNFTARAQRRRLMPEPKVADDDFGNNAAAEPGRQHGVVIAFDPDPF